MKTSGFFTLYPKTALELAAGAFQHNKMAVDDVISTDKFAGGSRTEQREKLSMITHLKL